MRAVSASSNLLGGSDWGMPFQYEGAEEGKELSSRVLVVDRHFLGTYGMEIIDGRNFADSFPTDEAEAYLLALPLAYYVSHSWLQRFAYRIGLSFAPFLFSGMLAMIIALITVSFLSIKAAKANPVDSLRYE